jgi:uncharacterized protein (TIGR00251 family)
MSPAPRRMDEEARNLAGLALHALDGGRATSLAVHAQPGARRSGAAGIHGAALKVHLRAKPDGGRANEELERVLAALLGVRPSSVRLVRGHSSRAKVVRIELPPGEVRRRLAALVSSP